MRSALLLTALCVGLSGCLGGMLLGPKVSPVPLSDGTQGYEVCHNPKRDLNTGAARVCQRGWHRVSFEAGDVFYQWCTIIRCR